MFNLLGPINAAGHFAPFDALSTSGHSSGHHILDKRTIRLLNRLDALMLVLKTCKGDTCANPYGKLLPPRLRHTRPGFLRLLDADLDGYFSQLPKVSFKACGLGYHRAQEQPEWDDAWSPRD